MATDMVLATVALHGLSRLGAASRPNDTIGWFVLLGLCLSPVMADATDVIVGHAQVALASVASGLQSTALQVGATIGTAVLGAIMAAKISSLLPASRHTAHVPPLTVPGSPCEERGLGRGRAGAPEHAAAGRPRDHPDQSRRFCRRNAHRVPGRGRGRPGQSHPRFGGQAGQRDPRTLRSHLTATG